jgi:ElaB/YqjD/DUF883 family membrane-anchored ribosome-binding protein
MAARTAKKSKSAPVEEMADWAAKAAHEKIDEFAEHAAEAEEDLVRRARSGGQSLVQRAGGIVQRVTGYVEAHPFMSVAVAFGVGILATTLLRNTGVNLAQYFAPEEPAPDDDLTD